MICLFVIPEILGKAWHNSKFIKVFDEDLHSSAGQVINKCCDVAVGQSKNLEEFFKKIYLNFRLTVRIIRVISKASFEYLQKNPKE